LYVSLGNPSRTRGFSLTIHSEVRSSIGISKDRFVPKLAKYRKATRPINFQWNPCLRGVSFPSELNRFRSSRKVARGGVGKEFTN
jgi:hypothetical protein